MKRSVLTFSLFFSFIFFTKAQAVFTSNGGVWNSAASWTLASGTDIDGLPDADDDVYIQSGHTITLANSESCKDLHIATGTTSAGTGAEGSIALGINDLNVNGKLRCYFDNIGTIPGTSSTGGYSVYPFTGTGGLVRATGISRALTLAGEWGATISTPSTGAFNFVVNLNAGQVLTLATNFKVTSLVVATGTFDVGTQTIGLDNGTAGQGNVTILPNATFASSGSANNIFQSTVGSAAGLLSVNTGGQIVLTGAAPKFQMSAYALSGTVVYGGTNQSWAAAGTSAGTIPLLYTNVTLANAGLKTSVATSNIQVLGKFSLQGTASFALGATSTITYFPGSNLEYAGSVAQTSTNAEFPAVSGPQSLTILNSNGVTLHAPRAVTGALTLTSGALTTTNTNLLTLAAGSTASSAVSTSFVNGPLKKIGNTNFTFPIGKTGYGMVPVSIESYTGGSATSAFTAEYVRTSAMAISTALVGGIHHVSYLDHWKIENSGTDIPTVNVTLSWNALTSNNGSFNYINDFLTLIAARYNSGTTAWDNFTASPVITGTFTAGTVTWNNLVMLGTGVVAPFSLGSTATSNPLPVSFNYLNATKQGAVNLIGYSINCGSNTNVVVELQRAGADKKYAAVQTVQATAVRCLQPFDFTDMAPLPGANYYRVKVTDALGKVTYSTVAPVLTSVSAFDMISMNATNANNSISINIVTSKKATIAILLTDAAGRVIQKQAAALFAGSNMFNFGVAKLSAGIYYLTATTAEGETKTMRFVKQ